MGAWQKPTLMEPNQTGSTRKVRRWLEEHDVDYIYRDLEEDPLSVDEIRLLLNLGDEGIGSVVSTQTLTRRKIEYEDLRLPTMIELIQSQQSVLRTPIVTDWNHCLVAGYSYDEIRVFVTPKERRQEMAVLQQRLAAEAS